MSIKEKISAEVSDIATKGKDVDAKTIALVKSEFDKAHAAADKSGASIKKLTEDILEGVQSGLKSAGHKTDELVSKSAEAIMEEAHKSVEASLDAARASADKAKAALSAASADAMDKSKEVMRNSYADLRKKTAMAESHLQNVADGIKAYSKTKSHDLSEAIREKFSATEKKAEAYAQTLKQASVEHSKSLLHHSEAKLSEWLGDLKSKFSHLNHKAK